MADWRSYFKEDGLIGRSYAADQKQKKLNAYADAIGEGPIADKVRSGALDPEGMRDVLALRDYQKLYASDMAGKEPVLEGSKDAVSKTKTRTPSDPYVQTTGKEGLVAQPGMTSAMDTETGGATATKTASSPYVNGGKTPDQIGNIPSPTNVNAPRTQVPISEAYDAKQFGVKSNKMQQQEEEDLRRLETIKSDVKAGADKTKALEEAQKGVQTTSRMFRGYEQAEKAVTDKYGKGYQASDIYGTAKRLGITVATYLGENPELKTYLNTLKSRAIRAARQAQPGVITERDAKAFSDTFANLLTESNETNVGLMANQVLAMYDNGADVSKIIEEFIGSNVQTMKDVVSQILAEEPALAEKLFGKGTVVQNEDN